MALADKRWLSECESGELRGLGVDDAVESNPFARRAVSKRGSWIDCGRDDRVCESRLGSSTKLGGLLVEGEVDVDARRISFSV